MEVELPRRDSARPLPASEESRPASPGAPSLHMSSSPRMDSGPRELFGVGMGVAAVRIIMGGAIVPRGSTWPLAVIIREYIFSSARGRRGQLGLFVRPRATRSRGSTYRCPGAAPPSRPPRSCRISSRRPTPIGWRRPGDTHGTVRPRSQFARSGRSHEGISALLRLISRRRMRRTI